MAVAVGVVDGISLSMMKKTYTAIPRELAFSIAIGFVKMTYR